MRKQIIYTFEYSSKGVTLKLICGSPWFDCSFEDAVNKFAKYISGYLNKDVPPVYVKPWMSKGYYITNKDSKYLTLPHLAQVKVDPDEYTVI